MLLRELVEQTAQATAPDINFGRGYPGPEVAQRTYDDADLNRAVEAYRFFYPTVVPASRKAFSFRGHNAGEEKSHKLARPKNLTPQLDDPSENTGIATFYKATASNHGRTAGGEVVDDDDLTAAHMTLPLGTRVHVVNLANDRSVVVRITDRATFPPGRIISVNYRAAKELDFLRAGTARVRLEAADK